MTAWYNEIDPYAAQWLRNLIDANHIAPGVVDERSIEDITPSDLHGFTQCHFFAGVGVWSAALRATGIDDTVPVWTGSCPCQPFSAAGKGGGFADERHLWPAWQWLIAQLLPPVVFGEQVASKDGLAWLDLVQTDMEALGYACGAVVAPAAGFGAPHIRHRTYWVADAGGFGRERGRPGEPCWRRSLAAAVGPCDADRLGLADRSGWIEGRPAAEGARYGGPAVTAGSADGLEQPSGLGRQRRQTPAPRHDADGPAPSWQESEHGRGLAGTSSLHPDGAGPTNGRWRDADWLGCRDNKWRPVEPSTFPLAHGAPARVGRLRAYGNAICLPQAQAFVEAWVLHTKCASR